MVKILVTGYEHSGTTMLMQLLRSHPQIAWIENEEGLIEFDKPKEWVLMMAKKRVENLKEFAWGEKIPWSDRPTDKNAERVIEFSKKWLKHFKNEARILHILRHPLDVFYSGRSYEMTNDKALNHIIKTTLKYIDFLNASKRNRTIVYENLVTDPITNLKKIFDFLNLLSDEKTIQKVINSDLKFGKINSNRAFAFKNKNIKSNIDYDEIIGKVKNLL